MSIELELSTYINNNNSLSRFPKIQRSVWNGNNFVVWEKMMIYMHFTFVPFTFARKISDVTFYLQKGSC